MQRYNGFLHTVPGISAKELTSNLCELEYAGLVARTTGKNGQAEVELYALTTLGSSLQPTFKALGSFGELLIPKRVRGGK